MPARSRDYRPVVEVLEDRFLLSTFLVTTTDDSGPGSLREAIRSADSLPGANTIAFDVGKGGTQTITPLSPLPAVTRPVVIDGTTQPGHTDGPLIVLDGSNPKAGPDGLVLLADHVTMKGLVVTKFTNGVVVVGSENVIGEANTKTSNLFAGNRNAGVLIAGDGNQMMGNSMLFNGTVADVDGFGVFVDGGSMNIIAGNLMSLNAFSGVAIVSSSGKSPVGNVVEDNLIGTDVTGSVALPNSQGVIILDGSLNTVSKNLVSGNTFIGVLVFGTSPTSAIENMVEDNFIGTNLTGTTVLPNETGVVLKGASLNTVRGNLISGNRRFGVALVGDTHNGPSGNVLQANLIGTNFAGGAALGNGNGVVILNGSDNIVGGDTPDAGNLISGNEACGVAIVGTAANYATGNRVQGNLIGSNLSGTVALANEFGVLVIDSSQNLVGGTTDRARNIISGNTEFGVVLAADGNAVEGNYIGTDTKGTDSVTNGTGVATLLGSNDTIGGEAVEDRNIISGNTRYGVLVFGGSNTRVEHNYIGPDATGQGDLGNSIGLAIFSETNVGEPNLAQDNVVTGNKSTDVIVSTLVGVFLLGNDNSEAQVGTEASTLFEAEGSVLVDVFSGQGGAPGGGLSSFLASLAASFSASLEQNEGRGGSSGDFFAAESDIRERLAMLTSVAEQFQLLAVPGSLKGAATILVATLFSSGSDESEYIERADNPSDVYSHSTREVNLSNKDARLIHFLAGVDDALSDSPSGDETPTTEPPRPEATPHPAGPIDEDPDPRSPINPRVFPSPDPQVVHDDTCADVANSGQSESCPELAVLQVAAERGDRGVADLIAACVTSGLWLASCLEGTDRAKKISSPIGPVAGVS
jgi:hypothetical protein